MDRREFLKLMVLTSGALLSCSPSKKKATGDLDRILQPYTTASNSLGLLIRTSDAEIRGLTVSGAQAISVWKDLREIVDAMGFWPVLIGDSASREMLVKAAASWTEETTARIIQAGSTRSFERWLEDIKSADPDLFTSPRGPWPNALVDDRRFMVNLDFRTGKPLKEIFLALVPTKQSWQVPAFFRYGGWNYCPPPHVHVAAFLKWERAYGAEIVTLTNDTIECTVSRPPKNQDAALKLAEEQYVYCPDIVDQGTETIDRLAAILKGNPVWYFWWD